MFICFSLYFSGYVFKKVLIFDVSYFIWQPEYCGTELSAFNDQWVVTDDKINHAFWLLVLIKE